MTTNSGNGHYEQNTVDSFVYSKQPVLVAPGEIIALETRIEYSVSEQLD